MRATIKDIAKAAQVSTSTVSRVLNHDPHVSEQAHSQVQRAIKELGYIPNYAARSLVSNKRRIIGLVIPELENPYYNLIISGVEKAANERGYGMILLCLSNIGTQKSSTEMLAELGVEGIIHAGPLTNDSLIPQLVNRQMDFVLLGRKIEGLNTNCVLTNDRFSGLTATSHLLKLGHQRIGFLFGKDESYSSRQKFLGYQDALEQFGVAFDMRLVETGGLQFAGGGQAVARLLEKQNPPTAILAGNDMMAFGARETIIEKGLRIPQDIALVGIDDIFWASVTGVELTTVCAPKLEMGYRASKLLIEHIENAELPIEQIELGTELIIRKSCGAYLSV